MKLHDDRGIMLYPELEPGESQDHRFRIYFDKKLLKTVIEIKEKEIEKLEKRI